MTIDELYKPIKEAVQNGDGNLEVYVQEFGKHRKLLPIEFLNIVSEWSSGNKNEYAEIVYKDDCSEEDKKIQYTVGYTQRLDDEIQSYRHERELIFDAWKKSNKESAHIIKSLLYCMQHRMGDYRTTQDTEVTCETMNNAENYVKQLESGSNYEIIIPVSKEK